MKLQFFLILTEIYCPLAISVRCKFFYYRIRLCWKEQCWKEQFESKIIGLKHNGKIFFFLFLMVKCIVILVICCYICCYISIYWIYVACSRKKEQLKLLKSKGELISRMSNIFDGISCISMYFRITSKGTKCIELCFIIAYYVIVFDQQKKTRIRRQDIRIRC